MSDAALPSLSDLQARFLQHMRIGNSSPRTIEQWRYTLGRFRSWCEDRAIESLSQVTPGLLAAYRRHLFHWRNAKTGKPLKFSTQVSYLTSVRGWCHWLAEQQLLAENVALQLELPKLEERLPTDVLSSDEVERILTVPDVTTPLGLRDRAILETLYSTAVRCSELLGLQIYDVESSRGIVKVRQGKGRKDRVVPISDRALRWLNKYVMDVRPQLITRTELPQLFVSCSGRALTRNNLSAMVRSHIVAAGCGQRRGACHLLRHSAATLMMEGGADIRALQMFLGHKRLNTTMLYTHVSIQHLQDVHRRTHPGS